MIKPKPWKGNDLTGEWVVSRKLDGVRAIIKDGIAMSRNGKHLYNLEAIDDGDYEVFKGNWETTVSMVRTIEGEPMESGDVYSIDPLDLRLFITTVKNPTSDWIQNLLEIQVAAGDEGIVLRQGDEALKVKPVHTYDVVVDEIVPGKGRHEGRLGAVITSMGKVGTGFTDMEREDPEKWVGKTVEVECMGLTPSGKFRHPRFVRERFDK